MNCRSVGGGNWRYNQSTGAGQIGVTGGVGLNNIGTLVRVFGAIKPKQTGDTGQIRLDDGSWTSVQVVLPTGETVPPEAYYAAVTGVVSCVRASSKISPVILARSVEWRQHAPGTPEIALGQPADAPNEGKVYLQASWPDATDTMNLYRSTDGVNWSRSDVTVARDELIDGPYGLAYVDGTANAYYRFTAENDGGESTPSETIHARPLVAQETTGVAIDSPYNGQTLVPRTPTFKWHGNWTQPAVVKWYDCRVWRQGYGFNWEVATIATPPLTTLVYGQSPGVRLIIPWQGPMLANTGYGVSIRAFDTGNWQFASGSSLFTTGP